MQTIDPEPIASKYVDEAAAGLQRLGEAPRVRGLVAGRDKPSIAYAKATKKTFKAAGFDYELCEVARLELEAAIREGNEDTTIHGLFIYFPVFHNRQDDYLRNLVHYTKDIEAGSQYWTRKLYENDRQATEGDRRKKALLPCTPLAIVKILTELGEYGGRETSKPLSGKQVALFNRSEVVGRPLAMMMSNDGAMVYSFDEHGPLRFQDAQASETDMDRKQALANADFVITGVPGNDFDKVRSEEIKPDAVCVNFSSSENFAPGVEDSARIFVPRVGPMTVAMCMRNALRLYENFHVEAK
ncbi:MAG: bifunctional methylenetetrahydrofolate dehydrogenase/methenyltetrahydrofolate cyclohydrolase [Pseudomonadales bacterium]